MAWAPGRRTRTRPGRKKALPATTNKAAAVASPKESGPEENTPNSRGAGEAEAKGASWKEQGKRPRLNSPTAPESIPNGRAEHNTKTA